MKWIQTPAFKRTSIALAVAAVSFSAQAGKIFTNDTNPSFAYGGWDLSRNVEVTLNPPATNFDECCGSYDHSGEEGFSYYADVLNGTVVVGRVLAKDWPVGEPPGIKVVHDDGFVKPPKPENCIMATSYLEDHFADSGEPQQVPCSGPFQSHKRYKLAMLPASVDGGVGQGIDLVFNVDAEAGTRDYQVFQKINNWTDVRLGGFTIQVGTGIGDDFVAAGNVESGVGVENLSLSVPEDVWPDGTKLANFSTGLFGPADKTHDRPPGYFDPDTRAGFVVAQYPVASGNTDTLSSSGTLGSDYGDLPPGAGAQGQFGHWLPNSMLPQGVFFDDDGNPETDAQLLAWYGYNPALNGLGWMTGVAEGFAEVDANTIESWGSNLTYTMGEIDDLVNVGLNYIVSIGDVSGFPDFEENPNQPDATFTIRITPKLLDEEAAPPSYVDEIPNPILEFTASDGVLEISPAPTFVPGDLLTVRVGDADLNDSVSVADEVDVTISADSVPSQTLTLVEQGENRGVFAASLPDEFSDIALGSKVTVVYEDYNIGDGELTEPVVKTAVTVATQEILPPPPVAILSITDFSAPESLFVGQTRKVSMSIANAREAGAPISGTMLIKADGATVVEEAFTDLAPNRKAKASGTWTAEQAADVIWEFSVELDSEQDPVEPKTATTVVTVKPGNKNTGPKK